MKQASSPAKTTQGFRILPDYRLIVMMGGLFVLIIGLSTLALQRIKTKTLDDTLANLQSMQGITGEALELWTRHRLHSIEVDARNPLLLAAIHALLKEPRRRSALLTHSAQYQLRALLSQHLQQFDDFNMYIIAPDQTTLASMRDDGVGAIHVIASQRKELLARVFAGETVLIPPIFSATDTPTPAETAEMFLVTPIYDAQQVIAVLALRISLLQDFSRIVLMGRIGQTGQTYGVDTEGHLLTAVRFAPLHAPSTTNGAIRIADPGGDLSAGHPLSGSPDSWPLTTPIKAAREGISGENLQGYRDYRGIAVYGAWQWHKNLGFVVVTEISVDEALQGFYETRNIVISLVTVLMLLTSLTLFLWFMLGLRKHSETALRETHLRFASIIDSAFDGIITIDKDGIMQSFNKTAERIFGWQAHEVVGKNINILMPEGDRHQHNHFIQHYNQSGAPKVIGTSGRELIAEHKTGVKFPLEISITQTYVGEQLIITGFIRDVSEAQQMKDALDEYHNHLETLVAQRTIELTQAKEEAEQARVIADASNKAKSEFLANMNHELRTPLNAILGYTQLLEQDEVIMQTQSDALQTIHKSADHLLQMINDLLDLAKIEAHKMTLAVSQIRLHELLHNVENIIRISARQKNLQFTVELPALLPIVVETDPKRLHQVLLNLLHNAVKFTPSGKVCLRVLMPYATEHTCQLRFEVQDTGIGIEKANLQRIFNAFFQAGSLENRAQGTGLGLSICQMLTKLLGGTLNVHSELGQGSLFSLELNVPCAFEAQVADTDRTLYKHIETYQGRRRKILIADDVESNRQLLHDLLAPLGFDISEADNGQQALDRILAWRPDLIFIDMKMPVLDGHEAIMRLREHPELDGMKIILVSTSSVLTADLAAGEHLDLLEKPFKISELVDKLQQQLNLSWIYKEAAVQTPEPPTQILWPPPTEIFALRHATQNGHTPKIKYILNQLMISDPRYKNFVMTIESFMKKFEFEKILEFLAHTGDA